MLNRMSGLQKGDLMFHIAVIDDDDIIREMITKRINIELINAEIEYKITSVSNVTDFFRNEISYDLAFLDIEIGSESGLELSKMIYEKYPKCIIVFITSYEHYMKDSFGLNVFSYLTKDEYAYRLPIILKSILKELLGKSVFNLKTENGFMTYKAEEILYLYINNRRIYMKTDEEVQVYYTSMKKLITELNDDFSFVGSKYIVNMNKIINITNGIIELENGECIFVPKGKVKIFTDKYKKFLMRKVKN